MAVRFIIGRAGTGKTHHCLTAIRSLLAKDPVDGPQLLLLVPEQAGLQMERALLGAEECGGHLSFCGGGDAESGTVTAAHRAQVLSFRRLAFRVLESAGASSWQVLSEPARAMVIRHLLAQRGDRLRYYQGCSRPSGLVDRLAQSVAELIDERINPARIRSIAEAQDTVDRGRAAKLRDLADIFEAYLEWLGTERLDPSQYLQAALDPLLHGPWLDGALLWVDGFASFSALERAALIALARRCASVEISIMMDPSLADEGCRAPFADETVRLFWRTYRTYAQLSQSFRESGLAVAEPILLAPDWAPRFAPGRTLARLERDVFTTAAGKEETSSAPARSPANCPKSPQQAAPTDLEVASVPTRRLEAEYAVARVLGWVRDEATRYRYRDMAIIARDLSLYHDLLTAALRARHVPFFIDRRRSTAHHPLVELLRGALALSAEPLNLEAVRLLLKTDFLPLTRERADELENYLLEHGISGKKAWFEMEWTKLPGRNLDAKLPESSAKEPSGEFLRRVNASKDRFLAAMRSWFEQCWSSPAQTGPEWANMLTELLALLDVGSRLRQWMQDAREEGDLDLAQEHQQIWRDVALFLDDLGFAFSRTRLSLHELAEVFEAGLAKFTLGLVPPMVDQVLIGSIDRSRHPNLRAVVLVGFNDGVFPARPAEDSILNDDDRAAMLDAGTTGRPPASERASDEALLVYTALTRASEALVITYAQADEEGKTLRPSPTLNAVLEACPDLVVRSCPDPLLSRRDDAVFATGDLARQLAAEFRSRLPLSAEPDIARRSHWNQVYLRFRSTLLTDSVIRNSWRSLGDAVEAGLAPDSVEKLYAKPYLASVSQLEVYGACPFQHFARYGLKLRERRPARLEPVDIGQFHHAILEDFMSDLVRSKRGLSELSESELMERLGSSAARMGERVAEQGFPFPARDAYLIARSRSQLARLVNAQRRLLAQGRTRTAAAELAFGVDQPGALPALELFTPKGRAVLLRGFIDRVDIAELGDELLGVVIDYKQTREKRISFDEVYHGLSLQLLAYLLVLAEHGRSLAGRTMRPLGAFYVGLAPGYEFVDHPGEVGKRSGVFPGSYRPRGILAAEYFSLLDHERTSPGWSPYYNLYVKSDGELGNVDRTDAADESSLDALLAHTKARLAELADGILDGRIAVSPYRLGTWSPCSWCPMRMVCRFEMGIDDVRWLEPLKRAEVFDRIGSSSSPSQGFH